MQSQPLSYVVGPAEPPLIDQTIGVTLDLAVQRWPHRQALVSCHQDVRLSWTELRDAADQFAGGLLALGLQPGDRVGIWAPNCAEWTVTQFATARAGMVLVNINPAYRISELEYTLRKVGVKALVCAASFKTSDYVAMVEGIVGQIPISGEIDTPSLPDLRRLILIGGDVRPGWAQFADVSRHRDEARRRCLQEISGRLSPHEPINIQFTSGTTGSPKGATLSHRNIVNNAFFVGRAMGLGEGDRLCIPVPLYHCFGMVMSNLACAIHGATMVYPSGGFDPGAVLRAVEAERCTALHGVPTMFIAELEHPQFDRFDLTSLRTGIMAGAPCPIEVMRQVIERMHLRDIGIAYGMTETSPVSFQTALDDTLERRVQTIGRVQPHLEVKIVDPSSGQIVPRGRPGELCTRGYSVMLGYWHDPDKTAEAIRDGWMHTGDLAIIDEHGYGMIVGRIKDMVIRGGENIYPREIEEFLMGHPAVSNVQVVGLPDEKYGEELCAFIIPKTGRIVDSQEIKRFCRDQLAHYKVPRYVLQVDGFPMTVSGKVQKFILRQQAAALLGQAASGRDPQ